MEIFAYSFNGGKTIGSIEKTFDYLEVEVIAGHEHIYAYKNGGTGKYPTCVGIVHGGFANITETDGSYFVDRDEVDKWLDRRDSYHWLYEDPTLETSE